MEQARQWHCLTQTNGAPICTLCTHMHIVQVMLWVPVLAQEHCKRNSLCKQYALRRAAHHTYSCWLSGLLLVQCSLIYLAFLQWSPRPLSFMKGRGPGKGCAHFMFTWQHHKLALYPGSFTWRRRKRTWLPLSAHAWNNNEFLWVGHKMCHDLTYVRIIQQ